jgi:hypothetical protein
MGLEVLLENPELASKVELKVNGTDLIEFFRKFKLKSERDHREKPPRYMKRDIAKEKLGIKSDATIISWEKKKLLRAFRVGRSVYYLEDEVEAILKEIQR